ncbi:hypothetical protein MKX01_014660, partial [Papaver californicum]
VIFTNESNIGCWKNERQAAIDSKIGWLKNFIDRVKVPIQVFIACGVESGGNGKDLFCTQHWNVEINGAIIQLGNCHRYGSVILRW